MTEGPEKPPEDAKSPSGKSTVREWAETLVVALVVALIIRAFVVQVYMVEGPSMEPTLYTGERLLVNKFVYRFRAPAPGEVIVLQDPGRPQRELIKRVIAVGGETVEVRNNVVFIDGKPLKEPFINAQAPKVDNRPPKEVRQGEIFVMGDNRSWSFDSRDMGPVSIDKVDGKAFFMFWPMNRFGSGPLDHPRQVDPNGTATK